MSPVNIQSAINEYHQMMTQMGVDMHDFHANWHQQNKDPQHPNAPNSDWGTNISFGKDFLQMHHEMVEALDTEEKFFMHHQSIVSWFNSKGYNLPLEWNPLTPIPNEFAYTPTNMSLKRKTNDPRFALPKYFTVQGIAQGEDPEPITRAVKLTDFKNLNQLGCCIIYPHNAWHNAIGGAMLYFNTAIDDPIFYFGVHWHIDKVYTTYLSLQHRLVAIEKTKRVIPEAFTKKGLEQLKTAEELAIKIRFDNKVKSIH